MSSSSSSNASAFSYPLAPRANPDIRIPKFIYGTAWKKEHTAELVYLAIRAGFRAFDAAAQPKHYNERGMGEGIRKAIEEGLVRREDLFIQTKYTPPSGQDPNNMPYDSTSSLEEQIINTLSSSLTNLTFPFTIQEPYIDSLILHSPLPTAALTLQAWSTLASYVPAKIRSIGISNTTLPILQTLTQSSQAFNPPLPFPAFCQNRFYGGTGYEVELRRFCREQGIVFQSFWTLSGNPSLLKTAVVEEVAGALEGRVERGEEKAVALYGLVVGLGGVSVLNGTTNMGRMIGDLKGLEVLRVLVESEWEERWQVWMRDFKGVIGES
ncbi:NADP-dependent oxidoreductase domain-containing protein [Cadophora sp. MPI-SDFR-AT-0126]|nr:NADP-dependent oxidoreductase domain-containing protein [Leotiomycetes sp. MPI-SDFR-AT-0126]